MNHMLITHVKDRSLNVRRGYLWCIANKDPFNLSGKKNYLIHVDCCANIEWKSVLASWLKNCMRIFITSITSIVKVIYIPPSGKVRQEFITIVVDRTLESRDFRNYINLKWPPEVQYKRCKNKIEFYCEEYLKLTVF